MPDVLNERTSMTLRDVLVPLRVATTYLRIFSSAVRIAQNNNLKLENKLPP